jgi:hypothetical protein
VDVALVKDFLAAEVIADVDVVEIEVTATEDGMIAVNCVTNPINDI